MNEDLVCGLVCLVALGCLALLIWLGTKVGKIRCPKCERPIKIQEIRTELIPGTEERIERRVDDHYGPHAYPRTYESKLYAEYRVLCGCPDCGYEWEKIDKRQVPGTEAKYETRM